MFTDWRVTAMPRDDQENDLFEKVEKISKHISTDSQSQTLLTSPTLYTTSLPPSPGRSTIYISGIILTLKQPIKGPIYLKLLINGQDFTRLPYKYDPQASTPISWSLEPFLSLSSDYRLTIQIRKRKLWLQRSLLHETTVDHHNLPQLGQRYVTVHQDPCIELEIAPMDNALEMALHTGMDKASDIMSALDRLGKSKKFLETLLQFSRAVSELDPIAKSVLGCVNVIYKLLREQDDYDKVVVQLAESMGRTLGYIEDVEQFARIYQLKKCIEDVKPLMEDTTNFILIFVNMTKTEQMFKSRKVQDQIDKLVKRYEIFQEQFDRGTNVQSLVTVEAVLQTISSGKDDHLLQELRPRHFTSNSLAEECMDGTREDVLSTIGEWVDDLESTNILWIRGFPGVGKSSIATTLISRLRKLNRLGSYFIFERAKTTTATPNALWRNVAYDLARHYPTARKVIIERLDDEEVDVDSSNVKTIFRNLIEAPLLSSNDIPKGRLPVIVVDALDECGPKVTSHSPDRDGLFWTLKRWSHLPSKFKLIVTSRGEDDIVRALNPISEPMDLSSGHHVKSQASADIKLYLTAQFGALSQDYTESLPPDWPGDAVIDEFANRAAGLFIWAKTLVQVIREGEPNSQMRQLLHDGIGLGDVSLLYARVLSRSFRVPSPDVLESFQRVVGAMVFAKQPLSRHEFAVLFNIEASMMDFLRKGLRPVIDDVDVMRFNHQSFVEFLLDSDKCPGGFLIVEEPQHYSLAHACVGIMQDCLRFNMCQLPTSHLRNSQYEDLEHRILEHVTTPVLYACKFWANHLESCHYDQELFEEVQQLLYEKLLFWFEVLSVTNEIYSAADALNSVIDWCASNSTTESRHFIQFLKDALKFVAAFGGVISQSAPHIYISALPFAPKRSKVAKRFLGSYPGTLKLQSGQYNRWPRILVVVDEHERSVNSVSFSRDGKFVASGSGDRTVCVWDAETGDLVSTPLDGHTSSVNSVAFSGDGRKVVSGSDDWTIGVWDAESGDVVVGPLHGHTNVGGVTAVAFSSDDLFVASGSFDRTVRIWDRASGDCIYGPFEGHSSWVNCVAFSPDGNYIASASEDETIQLWNVLEGDVASAPWEGHTDSVTSIAFSSDGKRLVSGSHDETLRIWDVATGELAGGAFTGHTNGVMSVAFSSDGKRLVSGSRDESIRIWDARPREDEDVFTPLPAHTDGVTSIAISPDGKYIISGSDDDTIRIWDASNGTAIKKFEGHTSWINSITVSPDNSLVASGSDDQTIRIWVISDDDHRCTQTTLSGHRNGITAVTFFPDSRRLVSGSYDNTVRIWDAETGDVLLGPLEPHASWVTTVAVSPDGALIASGSQDNSIAILSAETGEEVAGPFLGHTGAVNSVAFSPDGSRIASASNDLTIRIWDVTTGDLLHAPFFGHTGIILCVSFSPDNLHVASGSADKTIRIWDSGTGEVALGPLEGHVGAVFSVAYAPDGSKLASASEDEIIRLWDISSQNIASELVDAGPIDFADDSGLQSGWIAGPDSSLLFWVPPWHRYGLWWPRNLLVISETPTKLDLSCFENGLSWGNCQVPASR
ncbi:WD40-repeat-containing domain protein [Panaeolus papilionaceus]|nr:WD40-repeat-containing domain protein [Panaeolus papilionaceus]